MVINMKTIKVDDNVHTKLMLKKLKGEYKEVQDVIKVLLGIKV